MLENNVNGFLVAIKDEYMMAVVLKRLIKDHALRKQFGNVHYYFQKKTSPM